MTEITIAEIYKEQYAHFRAMNDILYKIPPIITAVLGGLWYFAATNPDAWLATGVFVFSGIASFLFIGVMARFRAAFNAYIDNINRFDGDHKVSIKGAMWWPSTIKLIQILLFIAMTFSFVGAFYKSPMMLCLNNKAVSSAVSSVDQLCATRPAPKP